MYTNVLDNSFSDMISFAVETTKSWASANNMLLNTDKTVLVNSTLSIENTDTIKKYWPMAPRSCHLIT